MRLDWMQDQGMPIPDCSSGVDGSIGRLLWPRMGIESIARSQCHIHVDPELVLIHKQMS